MTSVLIDLKESVLIRYSGFRLVSPYVIFCYKTGSNPDTVLYEWRNVPRSDSYSPAHLLFGRRQRKSLLLLPIQNRDSCSGSIFHSNFFDPPNLSKGLTPSTFF